MTPEEIKEGNRIIAKFIAIDTCFEDGYRIGDEWFDLNRMLFHSSWDWLMPVIESIEHIYEDEHSLPRFEINSHHCEFAVVHPLKYKKWIVGCYPESPESIKANSKIEAAHMVVVEFIKWYNLCKNNL